MTAFTAKSFTVACSSGSISDDEARARWEAVFGPRPEKTMEIDPAAQTLHFQPCQCQECQTICRVCGARTNELRDGRVVLVTHGRCGPCADVERARIIEQSRAREPQAPESYHRRVADIFTRGER